MIRWSMSSIRNILPPNPQRGVVDDRSSAIYISIHDDGATCRTRFAARTGAAGADSYRPPLPHVPADVLHGRLLDQPVDGPGRPGRHRPGDLPVGAAGRRVPGAGPPGRADRARTR